MATTALVLTSSVTRARAADPDVLSIEQQRQLVSDIADLLEREYVFEHVGRAAAATLRKQVADGTIAAPASREAFAASMTGTLLELTRDKHVRIRYRADGGPAATMEPAGMDNFGIRKVEYLDGGVGYLKVDAFHQRDESRPAFNAALSLLERSRAIVIDLRDNRGGSDANILLSSYFLARPTLITRLRWRDGERMEFVTEQTTPSLPDVPVYVLTSSRTFSAGEAFAYGLQQQKRITIVGERTAGAGNPNRYFPLAPGLAVSIAVGETINAVTGTSWEHVGVEPDIEVPADRALDAALEAIAKHAR